MANALLLAVRQLVWVRVDLCSGTDPVEQIPCPFVGLDLDLGDVFDL
jgi:hypothetical protein